MSDQAIEAVGATTSLEDRKYNKNLHIREKIRASKILQRVEQAALGEITMTRDELRAAEITLKKVIPDLAAITVKGDDDAPLEMKVRGAVELIRVTKRIE